MSSILPLPSKQYGEQFISLISSPCDYFNFSAVMGTELAGPRVKEEKMEIPSIPPGFESLVPFTLKRVDDHKGFSSASDSVSEPQASQLKTEFACKNDSSIMKTLRRRSSINYSQFSNSSSDDSDSEQVNRVLAL